jgi:uncharacterized protein YbjT (DUF2867 family)
MMSRDPVVVTGATGSVGGEVVRRLAEAGVPTVAAVRDPARFRPPADGPVRARPFDFHDPATHASTFEGARALFLVRPPAIARVRRDIFPALDAARVAGVRRVVFLSLLGAENNRVVPHRAIEDYLQHRGMAWTFLRAGFFMQNLTTTHRTDIRDLDEIIVPAGGGRTSFIDTRDIAAVAVRALTDSGHEQQAYPLTGPEALGYDEVAAILSRVLGRTIRYRRPGLLRFALHMRRLGHPIPFILVMAGIYTTTRLGLADRITDEVPRILDRPPTPFTQFARDHRQAWERPGSR